MGILKVKNVSSNPLPEYATQGSAGFDLRANINTPIVMYPMETCSVPTGIFIEIEEGYEGQVRPRSGLAVKNGITVLNAPGTIDSDYRDEVKVILVNLGSQPFTIQNGERIAQMVVSKYDKVSIVPVDDVLNNTQRKGGFGHTGIS
jgi:dUTP pyrophosphatase